MYVVPESGKNSLPRSRRDMAVYISEKKAIRGELPLYMAFVLFCLEMLKEI